MTKQVMTLEEIHGQPTAWRNTLESLKQGALISALAGHRPSAAEWVFLGCGTSYYLAQAAATSISFQTGAATRASPASELLFYPDTVLASSGKPVFPVLISRSGMTSEIVRAAQMLREGGVPFLGVTCDGGELKALAPFALHALAPERSTVMTASFTSMLLALQYLAQALENRAVDAFDQLPHAGARFLEESEATLRDLATRRFENYVFLGQGPLFGVAQECALKLTESSCSYTQSYHTLEFRHGPKSIAAPEVLIAFSLSEAGYREEVEVLREMKNLGATTLVVANAISPELKRLADYALALEADVPEMLRTAIYAITGQLLGCYAGLHKGLNPDSPKNLTRVVMIES